MAIAKRLSAEERADKAEKRLRESLPKGWDRATLHPLLLKICYDKRFEPTAYNVFNAIRTVKGWRGATDTEKVFVLALDLVMEKAFGEGVIEPDTYNRLWDHLLNNEENLEFYPKQVFLWDIFNDHYGLNNIEPGGLHLPERFRKIKLKRKKTRK